MSVTYRVFVREIAPYFPSWLLHLNYAFVSSFPIPLLHGVSGLSQQDDEQARLEVPGKAHHGLLKHHPNLAG